MTASAHDRAATCSGCSSRCSRWPTAPTHRIPTPELNRFLGDVVATRQPPQKQGHRLKLLYIAQIGERPPRFSIQVNSRDQGHARLRVLRREPAARALRAGGHPADHRLRRAQAAPPRGVSAPLERTHARSSSRRSPLLALAAGLVCCARRRRRRAARRRGEARARERAGLRAPRHRPGPRAPTPAWRGSPARCRSCARMRDRIAAPRSRRGAFDLERDVRPWLGDEIAYAARVPDRLRRARRGRRPPEGARRSWRGSATSSAAERYRGVRVLVAGATALAFVGDFLAVGTEAGGARRRSTATAGRRRALADAAGVPARGRRPPGRARRSTRTPRRAGRAHGARPARRAARRARRAARPARADRRRRVGDAPRSDGLRTHVRLGRRRARATPPSRRVLLERVPGGAPRPTSASRSALRLARLLGRLGAAGPLERLGDALADEAGIDLDARPARAARGRVGARGHGRRRRTRRAPAAARPSSRSRPARADPRRDRGGARPAPGPARAPARAARARCPRFTRRADRRHRRLHAARDARAGDRPTRSPTASLVISTAPAGLAAAARHAGGGSRLRGDDRRRAREQADSLVFLDLRQLLALGEQTGLTAIPGLATRPRRPAVACAPPAPSSPTDPAHPSDTTAELFLEIP